MECEDLIILKDFFYHLLKILYPIPLTNFCYLKFQKFQYLVVYHDYDALLRPNYYKIQYELFYLFFLNQFPLQMDVIEVQAKLISHLEPC